MRHHNKIILAERRKRFQWHKMKRAGKNMCNFSPLALSLSPFFLLLFVPFFSGTLLGGGGLKPPQAPPPPLGCAPVPGCKTFPSCATSTGTNCTILTTEHCYHGTTQNTHYSLALSVTDCSFSVFNIALFYLP